VADQKEMQINDMILQMQNKLAIRPNDSNALYTLSLLNSYLGHYDESIKYLSAMLKLTPNNPDVYYNIACIYGKQNNKEESIKYLKISTAKGFNKWSLLKNDSDLDILKTTTYYKEQINNH
jgi:tetratricopeptide (TPR) repeat protein